MSKTIVQKVVFKNATPKQLYDLYMDSKKHTESTGMSAKISDKEGTDFTVSDGYITGKNLKLVKNELIVQTWKASDWAEGALDSIFIIRLEAKGKDTVLYATHVNVPDEQAADIDDGWHTYYWNLWKKHLAGKPIPKAQGM